MLSTAINTRRIAFFILMLPKDLVIAAFKNILEAPELNLALVEQYFSKEYIQQVDGKTITYTEFISHLKKQKEVFESAKISFLSIAQEGAEVFTNHEVAAKKKNGQVARFKVIAQFTIKDGKIIACDELTRMIEGEKRDRDLGSRQ